MQLFALKDWAHTIHFLKEMQIYIELDVDSNCAGVILPNSECACKSNLP